MLNLKRFGSFDPTKHTSFHLFLPLPLHTPLNRPRFLVGLFLGNVFVNYLSTYSDLIGSATCHLEDVTGTPISEVVRISERKKKHRGFAKFTLLELETSKSLTTFVSSWIHEPFQPAITWGNG